MSLIRLVGIWVVLVIAMSANGIFRELVLRPRLGNGGAEIVSAVLGATIILIGTRYFLRSLAGHPTAELFVASAVLVVLTVAFEFLFGHYVDHKSWHELIANYAIWRGRLWLLLLLLVALTPFLWGRWFPVEAARASQ